MYLLNYAEIISDHISNKRMVQLELPLMMNYITKWMVTMLFGHSILTNQ